MPALKKIWRYAKWPLAVLAVGYVVLVAWRVQVLTQEEQTAKDVAAIHANRLTEDQVYGPLPVRFLAPPGGATGRVPQA